LAAFKDNELHRATFDYINQLNASLLQLYTDRPLMEGDIIEVRARIGHYDR